MGHNYAADNRKRRRKRRLKEERRLAGKQLGHGTEILLANPLMSPLFPRVLTTAELAVLYANGLGMQLPFTL